MRAVAIALSAFALVTTACAQNVRDPRLAALLDANRHAEAQLAATQRIAAQPDDMDGYAALSIAALGSNDAAQREAALKQFEACSTRFPNAAMCHFGTGAVLGAHAMSLGMVKGLTSAGKVRDELARAVELDPLLYAARNALVQFYLVVPGIAGGSIAKAQEVASAAAVRQPEHAKALLAMVAIEQKRFEAAEQGLASVRTASDKELAADVADLRAQIGFRYLGDKQDAKARAAFERALQERPQSALAHYGLGRVLTDAGQFDQAIAAFDRAVQFDNRTLVQIDYRLALAWQGKGDRDRARTLLTRFVAAGKGSPKDIDDAKKRLKELG